MFNRIIQTIVNFFASFLPSRRRAAAEKSLERKVQGLKLVVVSPIRQQRNAYPNKPGLVHFQTNAGDLRSGKVVGTRTSDDGSVIVRRRQHPKSGCFTCHLVVN